MPVVAIETANAQKEHTMDELKQQQEVSVKVNGKKRIVPVTVRQFADVSQSINPLVNPFHK
jgi:hypothetical protein